MTKTDAERLEQARAYVRALHRDIAVTLRAAAGPPAACKYCGEKEIFFLPTVNGKHLPVTKQGRSHFADCEGAQKAKADALRKAGINDE